mgnify:CR=1 FL=1
MSGQAEGTNGTGHSFLAIRGVEDAKYFDEARGVLGEMSLAVSYASKSSASSWKASKKTSSPMGSPF